MGLMDLVKSAASGLSKMAGSASLREAYLDHKAPNQPGVYRLFHGGQLMKVGKAADGLFKRFSDYYRGVEGGTAGLRHITRENRDQVGVSWMVCTKDAARRLEQEWYDEARARGEEMPWSERR